jgi:hypothetical protein
MLAQLEKYALWPNLFAYLLNPLPEALFEIDQLVYENNEDLYHCAKHLL